MSERTNTDVVQQGYEALGRGDIPAVLDLLTDDVEWIQQGPSVIPFAGTRHGHEGVAEYFSLLDENLEFEQLEPDLLTNPAKHGCRHDERKSATPAGIPRRGPGRLLAPQMPVVPTAGNAVAIEPGLAPRLVVRE